jgi:hypothetical protein
MINRLMQLTMPLMLALALGADGLTAQQAQPGMETRAGEAPVERCVAGAAILNARGVVPDAVSVLEGMRRCDRSGGEALANAWQNPSVLSTALNPLAGASMEILDRRILDEVLPIALDESAEEALRLSAITVLGSYLIPGASTGGGGWFRGDETTIWPTGGFGRSSKPFWMEGEVPITQADRDQVEAALTRLGEESESERIRNVMQLLLGEYQRHRERNPTR